MVVCHCAVVTDRQVIASIAAGARNVADICRTTYAGRTCGGCVPTLRELACQHCPLVQPAEGGLAEGRPAATQRPQIRTAAEEMASATA